MIEMKPYYTQEEIADYLGVTIFAVRKWRKAGKLGFTRIGRVVRIDRASLESFLAAHTYPATGETHSEAAI